MSDEPRNSYEKLIADAQAIGGAIGDIVNGLRARVAELEAELAKREAAPVVKESLTTVPAVEADLIDRMADMLENLASMIHNRDVAALQFVDGAMSLSLEGKYLLASCGVEQSAKREAVLITRCPLCCCVSDGSSPEHNNDCPSVSKREAVAVPDATGERESAEETYTRRAFGYEMNPVGSRDWTLFWSGWCARAVLAAQQHIDGSYCPQCMTMRPFHASHCPLSATASAAQQQKAGGAE